MQDALLHSLARIDLFTELSAEQMAPIARHTSKHHLARGETLFERGDPALGLYILQRGQIKLGITSPQGAEKVVSIIHPGESFGEAVLFLERRFPVYAQATLESDVIVIAKGAIFALLDQDPAIARKMLAGLSTRMHRLLGDIEMLSLQSSMERFVGYLLQTGAGQPDATKVLLPANKGTIASLLNLTPETLSRTMTKLQQAGLIEVHGKEILINLAGLRKHIGNGI